MLQDVNVFGMTLGDVKTLADYTGDSANSLVIQGDWKLSYYTGDLVYSDTLPAPYQRLHAYGILVVDGDLTFKKPTGGTVLPSSYGGVVFVTGDITIEDGCEIDGAVIMGSPYAHGAMGEVHLTGSNGYFAQIIYNPNLVATAKSQVAQYREDISVRKAFSQILNP